jgi:hypothetical protein
MLISLTEGCGDGGVAEELSDLPKGMCPITPKGQFLFFFFFHRILARKVLCLFPYQHGTN